MNLRSLTYCTKSKFFTSQKQSKQFHRSYKIRVEQSKAGSIVQSKKKSKEGRPVDALALGGDEGRDKLR